ncbi:hypothetical protein FB45DRAFT_915550 [Roridomyces roridus]|uniref:Uncharacterized protein n=1 Tax=Roridomyces roridus TaxID=1738132 RepID=A0AAD7BTT5_9AGAR|nr:hypothetical protein FB45DRAFT_915550 [Roridomyces roridus]
MWCTRWFLPLLLLPLPTAPPYFLVLFLLALFIQSKPCFYCIVLLVTLFFSSCYWQPFPIDSTLSKPWADNITTFRDALNATIPTPYDKPLPPVMRTLDRCWCDFWEGGFFEPYNVSHWERSSILKLADQLHSARKAELEAEAEAQAKESPTAPASTMDMPRTAAPSEPSSSTTRRKGSVASNVWSLVNPYLRPRTTPETSEPVPEIPVAPEEAPSLPVLRWEYDLRPYGLGVVVDLGWNRS